jgi:protein TonB
VGAIASIVERAGKSTRETGGREAARGLRCPPAPMFASVCETPRRQFGSGALFSFAAHATLVAIAVLLSPKPRIEEPTRTRDMVLIGAPLKPRPAAPPPAGTPDSPKRTASATQRLTERPTPRQPPAEPSAARQPSAQSQAVSDAPSSSGEGSSDATTPAGVPNGDGPATAPPAGLYEAIPFGDGMVAPRLMARKEIEYSAKAWAMKIGGEAIARCIIELDGSLSECRIVGHLPFMDDQILAALHGWRYTPVLYQGHPQRVRMTIRIQLATPR